MITFAPQNVVIDPPLSHMDLISCRNLLIHLGPDLPAPMGREVGQDVPHQGSTGLDVGDRGSRVRSK